MIVLRKTERFPVKMKSLPVGSVVVCRVVNVVSAGGGKIHFVLDFEIKVARKKEVDGKRVENAVFGQVNCLRASEKVGKTMTQMVKIHSVNGLRKKKFAKVPPVEGVGKVRGGCPRGEEGWGRVPAGPGLSKRVCDTAGRVARRGGWAPWGSKRVR